MKRVSRALPRPRPPQKRGEKGVRWKKQGVGGVFFRGCVMGKGSYACQLKARGCRIKHKWMWMEEGWKKSSVN